MWSSGKVAAAGAGAAALLLAVGLRVGLPTCLVGVAVFYRGPNPPDWSKIAVKDWKVARR